MSKPVAVAIEHHSSREEVVHRLRDNFSQIRDRIAPYISSIEEKWTENGVEMTVAAMLQTVTGRIEVDDRYVRIEVMLPALLGLFSDYIATRLRQDGAALLKKM